MIRPPISKSKSLPLYRYEGLTKELPLRSYQWDSISETNELFDVYQRIVIQQPTGAGKSLILMELVRRAIQSGVKVMLIAHKVELIEQLLGHCRRWLPSVSVAVIGDKSRYERDFSAQVLILSIYAWRFVAEGDRPDVGLIVIDESHHSHSKSYADLIAHYEDVRVVGVTATPMRLDGRGLRTLHGGVPGFQALVKGVSVQWLIQNKFLSPFKFFAAKTLIDPRAAGVHTRCGDYAHDELVTLANEVLIYGDVVTTWETHALGRLTVIYPVSVEASKNLCEEFNARGHKAAHIDSNTPAREREQILQDFRDRKITILCQHSIVIEGVDVPAIECVVFARPTQSLTIWFQAIGRALRPAQGKDFALIIDHTTTHQNLPFPDDPIEWSLDPISLPEGTKHALTCPKCDHVFRSTKHELDQRWSQCPNCQTKFSFEVHRGGAGVDPRTVRIVDADFQGIDIDNPNPEVIAAIEESLKISQERNYKRGWVFHEIKRRVLDGELETITLADLKALANKLGYQTGWAFYKLREIEAERSAS